MKKIINFILGAVVALNLSVSVANAAANEVRIAFFLEWATPNQEDKVKQTFDKAFGVPVKWTNFATGGEMTEAMLSGDIDISYSQGLTPFVNAVNAKAPIILVDIAVLYGMGGTTCVVSNASGITKANASDLEGKKPNAKKIKSFIVPKQTGVNYKPGIWHFPLISTKNMNFLVIDRKGIGNNLVIYNFKNEKISLKYK